MANLTRERNFDLIRLILLEIESSSPDSTIAELEIDHYDPSVITLHVEMLNDAGFIDAVIEHTFDSTHYLIRKILWSGYEFLDNAKNDTVRQLTRRSHF